MRIVIIEDEQLNADYLADTLQRIDKNLVIMAVLDSVDFAKQWFLKNEKPDLIFSDIQLGDGLCFDIFSNMETDIPVVFCTAYDEYALRAFKTNGIDYILKPYDETALSAALQKFRKLKEPVQNIKAQIELMLDIYSKGMKESASSLLVYKRDKILPIRFTNIALFYIENEITHLLTFENSSYTINKTMEEIESLTGAGFFRVNRQCIVNKTAVKEASQYFSRTLVVKLTIPFKEYVTVSKNRVAGFLQWLSS